MGHVGTDVASARLALLDDLRAFVGTAYSDVADRPAPVTLTYRSVWFDRPDGLPGALAEGRIDDARRGLSLIGPHRDDVELLIEGRPSRTHASQGEQRTLSLALRLAAHRLLTDRLGEPPLLLLDDVFSELDPQRSDALVRHLPPGQALLATAGFVPPAAEVESILRVARTSGSTRLLPVDKAVESVDETAWNRVT